MSVLVRPVPKVAFLYLTGVISLLGALWPGEPGAGMGLTWTIIFFFNLLVLTVDFSGERSLVLAIVVVAVLLGLLWAGALGDVGGFVAGLNPVMNRTFYVLMTLGFGATLGWVWWRGRVDYWEVLPNEVIHHSGVFKRTKSYPTEGLRFETRSPDMFERLLLGSGTLILHLKGESRPVVIDDVFGIRRVAARLKEMDFGSGQPE